jgi:ATP phosphoribosyltransferase
MSALTLAIPSKGRLMEDTAALLARAGLAIDRLGADRGYRGLLRGIAGVEVAFLPASEIAQNLAEGKLDMGVTGQDLLAEKLPPGNSGLALLSHLDFGRADVVVAAPECWLDVATMADLDDVAESFYERHGRRLRVATKYRNLSRRFFAARGLTDYRIVESLGATEGAPAAGIAEVIVDITTTGATLSANHLKILDDGVILRSSAVLAARSAVTADDRVQQLRNRLAAIT